MSPPPTSLSGDSGDRGDDNGAGSGGGPAEGENQSKLRPTVDLDPERGYWPPWWRKYANDWRRAKNAKANDGLVAPRQADPKWADQSGASTDVVLDAARRRHEQAENRIVTAEARAARLTRTALTLLAITFVITGFEANRLREIDASPVLWLILVLPILAIVMFAFAVLEAVGVDRVGYVQPPNPGRAARHQTEDEQRRDLAVQEILAAHMANWTARHKVNEYLQARAWLTRGISILLAAGVGMAVLWAFTP